MVYNVCIVLYLLNVSRLSVMDRARPLEPPRGSASLFSTPDARIPPPPPPPPRPLLPSALFRPLILAVLLLVDVMVEAELLEAAAAAAIEAVILHRSCRQRFCLVEQSAERWRCCRRRLCFTWRLLFQLPFLLFCGGGALSRPSLTACFWKKNGLFSNSLGSLFSAQGISIERS